MLEDQGRLIVCQTIFALRERSLHLSLFNFIPLTLDEVYQAVEVCFSCLKRKVLSVLGGFSSVWTLNASSIELILGGEFHSNFKFIVFINRLDLPLKLNLTIS